MERRSGLGTRRDVFAPGPDPRARSRLSLSGIATPAAAPAYRLQPDPESQPETLLLYLREDSQVSSLLLKHLVKIAQPG
jgi:hypothetical protein